MATLDRFVRDGDLHAAYVRLSPALARDGGVSWSEEAEALLPEDEWARAILLKLDWREQATARAPSSR